MLKIIDLSWKLLYTAQCNQEIQRQLRETYKGVTNILNKILKKYEEIIIGKLFS